MTNTKAVQMNAANSSQYSKTVLEGESEKIFN